MIAETLTDLNYKVIENTEKLREIIPELENESAIAIDTEGSRFDPFSAKLLLLQLATTKKAWVIDCAKEQLDYAAGDVLVLHEIFRKQFKTLQEENLIETAKLEFSLVPVVAD